MSNEYVHFSNNSQPAVNEDNLNLMQQLIKQDINGAVSGDTLPLGAMIPFPGGTIPDNYLLCDGSAVSRTTYALLFNVIGTTYGPGDGSTTFNLPDMRSRTLVGVDTRDSDLNAVGKTYGEKTHTLTQNQLPANMIDTANTGSNIDGYIARAGYTKTGSYNFGGAGQPFNIMQPSMATNYIIKAFQTAGVVAEVVSTHTSSATDVYNCNYINNATKNSTSEHRVGTWTDGKPLYEVTFYAGYLANNGRTTPSISGIVPTTAVVKDIQGVAYRAPSGGQGYNDYMPLHIVCSSVLVRPELSTIYLDTTTDRTAWKLTITLRYTKTTD
jgi:microcystin-dependent protein